MTFLNNTGLERLWSKITSKLDLKVDKVNGKGLSTNDYTTTEKNKLAGIATGATKTVVDTALSSSSTNPVQNKVVNTAISNLNTLVGDTAVSTQITNAVANKVDKVSGKGLSTNDYTTAEKNKLSGIDTEANKTIVDSVLSTTSTNPVQNKVVNTAISNLNTLVGGKSVSSQISTAIASKADIGHTHTKSEVGLGNVDNTADANKSVKYATRAGSAASVTGTLPIEHGGTGASNSFAAQMNLNMVYNHDIAAPGGQDDWRRKALAQIKENAKAGGFQCGSIGWQGVQFGQYFATTSGGITDRILALIYNSAGTNYALEVWSYGDNVWNACAVKGASLQTLPVDGYGTAAQRPAAGRPGRIWFQKV